MKKGPGLEHYNWKGEATIIAGIDCGIEFDLRTVSTELIEAMIERGSTNWEKKKAAAPTAKKEKE